VARQPGIISEHSIQATFVAWCRAHSDPRLGLIIAIPNGARRTWWERKTNLELGLLAGVSDLFLPVANNGSHGLWLEMKRPGGVLTEAQHNWFTRMRRQGYRCECCRSLDEGITAVTEYLGVVGDETPGSL
jgi:hypothetical protein